MITLTREEAEQVLKLLDKFDTFNDFTDVRQPLRARLAQPEPDPVAWISTSPARMIHWKSDKPVYDDDWIPLYTAPPQRKECLRCGEVNPADIHTCTPQREWVDLTEDEIEDLTSVMFEEPSDEEVIDFALRVQAKLKEKNIHEMR